MEIVFFAISSLVYLLNDIETLYLRWINLQTDVNWKWSLCITIIYSLVFYGFNTRR